MDANETSLIEAPQNGAATRTTDRSKKKVKFLLTLKHVTPEKWDEIVSGFDGVCQEMTTAFAGNRWPGVALDPVVMYDGRKAVAGALVMVQRLPLGIAKLAVIKWGPALKDETSSSCQAIYGQSVELLMSEFARKHGMMLSIMARAPRRKSAECIKFLAWSGFRAGVELLYPNRYIVRLSLDDAAQRRSFGQKWRYHLNKAEKEGLVFEHASSDQLPDFERLYDAMTDRKKFPDYSAYETIPHLMAAKVEALRPRLFFVRKDGEIVAGALIFTAGRTATYLYGATSDKALPLRAGYFMQWNIIRWLRDNTGAEYYDLGGTDGFQGLHQFKKGMVGSEGLITPVPPVYNYASNPVALVVGTVAYAARDGLHELKRFINWLRNDMARPNQER